MRFRVPEGHPRTLWLFADGEVRTRRVAARHPDRPLRWGDLEQRVLSR